MVSYTQAQDSKMYPITVKVNDYLLTQRCKKELRSNAYLILVHGAMNKEEMLKSLIDFAPCGGELGAYHTVAIATSQSGTDYYKEPHTLCIVQCKIRASTRAPLVNSAVWMCKLNRHPIYEPAIATHRNYKDMLEMMQGIDSNILVRGEYYLALQPRPTIALSIIYHVFDPSTPDMAKHMEGLELTMRVSLHTHLSGSGWVLSSRADTLAVEHGNVCLRMIPSHVGAVGEHPGTVEFILDYILEDWDSEEEHTCVDANPDTTIVASLMSKCMHVYTSQLGYFLAPRYKITTTIYYPSPTEVEIG